MGKYELTEKIKKDEILNEDSNIFSVKKTELSNENFKLVQYKKKNLEKDKYDTHGLIRSCIFNLDNNMICYSPPKSLTLDKFIMCSPENVVAEEFVEGTMVNLFYSNDKWHISTKSSIGGNCRFYQGEDELPTFYEMFFEICKKVNLDFDSLSQRYCYTFIMQSKKNRVVKPVKTDNLYFITAYEIVNENDKIYVEDISTNSEKIEKLKIFFKEATAVKFPELYKSISKSSFISDVNDITEQYASKNTKYDIMGVVFKDVETGRFVKIRNINHKEVHDLKGNHCKIQYIYLDLRKTNNIDKYLKYYPEDKNMFSYFRNNLHKYTNQLYENYVNCYIKKKKPLKEWPYEFRIHMFNIHQKYLSELKQQNKYVNMYVVIQYFNDLHPSQQMYVLNYNLRKKNMDSINIELEESNI